MEVVAYVNNADLLLEDENQVAVVYGSHYVLSLGDRVFIKEIIDQHAQIYQVAISFQSADHQMMHDDQLCVRHLGDRHSLQTYIQRTTVH